MASFEDIQKKEFEALTAEICTLGRRLVELGWSRDQVLAYGPNPRIPHCKGSMSAVVEPAAV